jgi:hypothetical protein
MAFAQFEVLAVSWAHLPPKQADAADLNFKQTVAAPVVIAIHIHISVV